MPKLPGRQKAKPEPQYAGGTLAEQPSVELETEPNDVRPEPETDRTEFDASTEETEPDSEGSLGGPFNEAFDHAEDKAEPVVTVAPKTVVLPQAEPKTTATLKAPVVPENRRPFDDYPTEPGWTRVLLDRVEFEGTILEPACGAGWMVQELQAAGHAVTFSDLERDGVDFLAYDGPQVENVVTNPPYKFLDEFAAKALEVATQKVALLLPDFSLVGVNRTKDLWQAHPPAKLILVASKMKVLGKVSMFPHIWAVWDQQHTGPTEFEWATVPKEQRVNTHTSEPTVSRNTNNNK